MHPTPSPATVFAGPGPRSLRDLRVPPELRVLVLGPHPDDFDAIAVTLARFRDNGNPIVAGVVRTGSGVDPAYRPGATRADRARLREDEQRASCGRFGLPHACLTFLDLENDADDQPCDNAGNRTRLERFVGANRPDVIFLPHGNDTNQGHRAMHALVRTVVAALSPAPVLLLNRDPKTVALRIDLYTPFGAAEAEWKGALLRCHDSQHQRNLATRGHGFDARILDHNRQTARELKLTAEFAEAFEVAGGRSVA